MAGVKQFPAKSKAEQAAALKKFQDAHHTVSLLKMKYKGLSPGQMSQIPEYATAWTAMNAAKAEEALSRGVVQKNSGIKSALKMLGVVGGAAGGYELLAGGLGGGATAVTQGPGTGVISGAAAPAASAGSTGGGVLGSLLPASGGTGVVAGGADMLLKGGGFSGGGFDIGQLGHFQLPNFSFGGDGGGNEMIAAPAPTAPEGGIFGMPSNATFIIMAIAAVIVVVLLVKK